MIILCRLVPNCRQRRRGFRTVDRRESARQAGERKRERRKDTEQDTERKKEREKARGWRREDGRGERRGCVHEPVARESNRCDRVRPAQIYAVFSCVVPPRCE